MRWLKWPPPNDTIGDSFPAPIVIEPDKTSQGYELNVQLDGEEYQKAVAGDGKFFFWGNLGYLDIFGNPHETYFCSEWNFSESRFVVPKHEKRKLNYYT